uniref:EOG090X013U n=1 Tax=Daphnia hispanica TaxID=575233 RepID=A0A4Y7M1L9_9CRUS|nr:EOG090X013U [Daphnia hispanica]
MPRLRLDAAPSNLMLENRNILKTTKSTTGVVAQKVQGPSLRPRAILGDLTKATAVSTNQVKNELPEEKIKKPAMGIASRKPLQSTNVKKTVSAAPPKAVVCTKKAEPEAYSTKQLPIEDIDLDRDNPQLVSYYAKDIYTYLRQLEKSYLIGAQYMDVDGYTIRPTMRTILVDWLIDVHGRFKMLQETLYLSISVMDSFLQSDSTINRRELQLVGLTAMLIAAKFEETWAPEINDFVYMSDKAYTSKDVLAMECRMLQKLDFRLGRPLPLHFLRRNTQAASQILDQSYETPYKAASAPAYSAPAYSAPAYSAPAYKGAGTANGRAKIQVYRGPTKEGGKGYDGFAPWGFYANQPEDNKAHEEIAGKKPIRIEDQEVRDENGRRRFHGAFTGGFSAGYYNTVDTKEGWRPAEFKSSRSDRQKKEQKPQDFMDDEDLGAFGIAPQVLRAKEDFGEGHVSRKRLRPVFATAGAIPGLPALHNLLHPVKETIGIKLLRSMGWKPNQGVGERLTKKAKKERRKRHEETRKYSCDLPSSLQQKENRQRNSDGEETGEESDDQLYAPDDVPAFVVKPKTNMFGLGYTGLMPHHGTSSTAPKSGFVLFEPTLKLTDRKKKLQIAGQAFGVGAFENEDEDIYSKDDMSQYDFELGGAKPKKKGSNMLALPCSDILDGFARAKKSEPVFKRYPLPVIPNDFVPIHRSLHSRFDVKPMTQAELRGLGRHDLNANQRAAILNEVLSMPPETPQAPAPAETVPVPLTPAEVVAQALLQIKKNIAAQQEKSGQIVQDKEQKAKLDKSAAVPSVIDPDREVEFDRSLTLYRPLTATMQNRFTSGGHVEENIQGGLVAQIESFLPQETPQPKKIPIVKDPAKQAALRKHFGPLTRKKIQWKPDRLLCIRFNVPNPFPSAGDAQDSAKFVAKGTSGSKFSIFDVLNAVPQAGPSFMSSGYENVPSGPVQGPENKVQELEWDKAERGELQEKAEPDLVPEIGPSLEIKEEVTEEVPYERPPMDVFRAIFADTDSEEEEEEDKKVEEVKTTQKHEQPKPPIVEEMDDDAYGPRLPASGSISSKVAAVSLTASQETSNQVEWVERDKAKKKKEHKKDKKKKDKKKKEKKNKEKKNKKRKRRHSDVSSSSSDDEVDDMEILKKIIRDFLEDDGLKPLTGDPAQPHKRQERRTNFSFSSNLPGMRYCWLAFLACLRRSISLYR